MPATLGKHGLAAQKTQMQSDRNKVVGLLRSNLKNDKTAIGDRLKSMRNQADYLNKLADTFEAKGIRQWGSVDDTVDEKVTAYLKRLGNSAPDFDASGKSAPAPAAA